MALGPQNPSNWHTADYWIELTTEGNVLIRPRRPRDMRHLAEWLFKELSRDLWRLSAGPIRRVIDRWFGSFHDFRLFGGEGAHEGALMVEALDSSESELAEWVARKLNAPEDRDADAMYERWLAVRELEARGKSLLGTDWVIARDQQLWASRQPEAHPAQPGLQKERFWAAGQWVENVNQAARYRTTEGAIAAMMNRNHPTAWVGCYLARVAAKPEPRYEVVDRP